MEKSGFQKKFGSRLESFSKSIRTSECRAPASDLVLQRGGLPSEIAIQGEASSAKLCMKGRYRLRKPKKNVAYNEQDSMKRGEKWYPEKLFFINMASQILSPIHPRSRYVRLGQCSRF